MQMDETTESPSDRRQGSAWRSLAFGSGVVLILWLVAISILFGGVDPITAVFGVLFIVGTALVRRPGKAGPITLLVVGILTFLVAGLFFSASLLHINTAVEFIISMVPLVASLAVILGTVGTLRRWQDAGARNVARIAVGGVVVLSGISIGMTLAVTDDIAEPGDHAVAASDAEFTTELIRADAGSVAVFVDNTDPIHHTFTIEELGVDLQIPGSTARRIEFDATPGTYEYICTIPGHDAMTGTLVVG